MIYISDLDKKYTYDMIYIYDMKYRMKNLKIY
jgi:hypothetical protein